MKKYFYYSATIAVAVLLVLTLFKFGVIKKTDQVDTDLMEQLQNTDHTEKTQGNGHAEQLQNIERAEQPQELPYGEEQSAITTEMASETPQAVQEETQPTQPPEVPSGISEEKVGTEEKVPPLSPKELKAESPDIFTIEADLLKMVAEGSEDQINKYLDKLSEEGKIGGDQRTQLSQMIFWRNFVSLQETPSCENLEGATKLFRLEKGLKSTWFTTQGMGFIMSKEITAAEKKWQELSTSCNDGEENGH